MVFSKMNKKSKWIPLTIIAIIMSYFFIPLQEPINNFMLSVIYGDPEVNIYITRNYAIFDLNEVKDPVDEYFLSAKGDKQIIVFKKILIELPNNRSYDSFKINTIYPYNYLVYIKNDGRSIAEDVEVIGRMNTEDYQTFDVDALIQMDKENKGGMYPNEKTIKFNIRRLKSESITSLRITPTNLSEISIDCTLKRGKCNYGVNDNLIMVPDNLPSRISTITDGARVDIIVPDYRNKTEGIFSYNFTKQKWIDVRQTKKVGYVIDI